jgi:hypothetical protein
MDFAPYVDRLFREAPDSRLEIRRNPITGGRWIKGKDRLKPQKEAACRALVARAWAEWHNPEMPPLPLSDMECASLKPKGGIEYLWSEFATSLWLRKYDTFEHPPFELYARGVMASPLAPDFIRNDPQLQKRFPPRPLPGIGPGLVWSPAVRRSK